MPAGAYYGVQTQRAVENFPISGLTAPPELVTATVLIKKAAARGQRRARPPAAPHRRARSSPPPTRCSHGALRDQFVVDVYQAGAGTSHNMNANEVLANRAAEILGGRRGDVHARPPERSRQHGTVDQRRVSRRRRGWRCCSCCRTCSRRRARSADGARTRRAAQFARRAEDRPHAPAGRRADHARPGVRRLRRERRARGGGRSNATVGAAARAEPRRHRRRHRAQRRRPTTRARRSATSRRYTALPLRPAADRFRVTQSMGDVLAYSGALRRLAVEVGKVASDLRLLSMGPRAGIAEMQLPAVQPGSSIMPGKVNPSVPEMVNQVCFQVIGCDATILAAADAGQLELNVMMPVIAWNALHATRILRAGDAASSQTRCVARHRGRRGALPRAARSQHRARDGAEPVHRLRRDGGDRQDVGRDRPADPRDLVRERRLLPDDAARRASSRRRR